MQALAIISYILVAAVVVFLSIKISDYVDLLDKKTKISGAFLGGILLAAVTSLPELFTSLTSTILIHNNQMVIGNILGSDLFDLLLFSIIFLFFFTNMVKSKVNKSFIISILICFALYIVTAIAGYIFNRNNLLWGWFNPMSLVIAVIYIISIIKTPKVEDAENKETKSTLTVKQITILFIICGVLLVGSSIGMTYLVDWLISLFGFGSTFAGALFLGLATSLPELTATITLSKKKNFNAAYGNIIGSCIFNFIILTFSDVFSFLVKSKQGQYIGVFFTDQSFFLLLVTGLISLTAVLISLIIKTKSNLKPTIKTRIAFISISSVLIASYIAFLVLSQINLNLPF